MPYQEPKYRIGQTVEWRGAWGSQPMKFAVITSLERTNRSREKYGVSVDHIMDGEHFVCNLDNGHWAYDFQINPVSPVHNSMGRTC